MSEYALADINYLGDNQFEVANATFDWLYKVANKGDFDCVNKPDSAWNKNGNTTIVFEGLLGEAAFGRLYDLPPNVEQGFKHIDFAINDVTIDVKTTKQDSLLVKSKQNGRTLTLHAQVYVSVSLISIDYDARRAALRINGAVTRDVLLKLPDVEARSRDGDWSNKVVAFAQLQPLAIIADRFGKES